MMRREGLKDQNEKIFGIHGGGNIGLGLMAHIVSQSDCHYNIVATSNNAFNCLLINSINKLWLQHASAEMNDSTCVNNVRMISRNRDDIILLYKTAYIVALCVTPAVLPNIANDIARGLIARFETDGSGLKILVLMNLPDCATFVKEKVYKEILLITQNESLTQEILSVIDFEPTVIDRIVTPIPEEKIKIQLQQQLKKIDKKTLKLELGTENINNILAIPKKVKKAVVVFNLQFNLFNAEKNFVMYVRDSFCDATHFPLIKVTHDLSLIESIKNKYINGPHAILAWRGALLGFDTIAQAIQHPALFTYIKEMMECEIAPILRAEYPKLSIKELETLADSFFDRCRASVDDTVVRVGRDPMRKLDSQGRIRGTLELAQKHNLKIPTPRLEQGLAAGFLYAVNFDNSKTGSQKIKEIYESHHYSFRAVLCYHGQFPGGTFTGLMPKKDELLINSVLSHIDAFNRHNEQQFMKLTSTHFILSNTSEMNSAAGVPRSLFMTKNAKNYFFPKFFLKNENGMNQFSQILVPIYKHLGLFNHKNSYNSDNTEMTENSDYKYKNFKMNVNPKFICNNMRR